MKFGLGIKYDFQPRTYYCIAFHHRMWTEDQKHNEMTATSTTQVIVLGPDMIQAHVRVQV